jgi:hypothetical protein
MAAFDFEHGKFGFASDFGIRISNFPGAALGSGSAGLGEGRRRRVTVP